MAETTEPTLRVVDKRGERKPYDYRKGVTPRVVEGCFRPHGERLLVRAILRQDTSELAAAVEYDPRDADAWEVLGVGGGVAAWYDARGVPDEERVRAGDHILHRSMAADRVELANEKCRYWLLHVEDVLARDPDPYV